jgi:hypothetical protein
VLKRETPGVGGTRADGGVLPGASPRPTGAEGDGLAEFVLTGAEVDDTSSVSFADTFPSRGRL